MRSTGMLRPVDQNGRIVLPMELRKQFDIKNDIDSLEIFTEDDKIILKKYQPCCIFCGELENVVSMKGHLVCVACIDKLNTLKNTL